MKATPTPVWLVTGYLGSGKTTLLSAWLREAPLADAALIVNEIGEVGLDDRLLAQAVDSAGLLSNACICCTGMQGLQEALQDLWWDRLHRRRPAFGSVVIETTGLADPGPVLEAFHSVEFLLQRYRLAGVVTTVAATAGAEVLAAHEEARAQVHHANVLIITKADRADATHLQAVLHRLNPAAAIAVSAQASVGWSEVVAGMARTGEGHGTLNHDHDHEHGPGHHHHHEAQAGFLPLDAPLSWSALEQRIAALRTTPLLRLKGVVDMEGRGLQTLQWSLGDEAPLLEPYQGPSAPLGLTYIQAR